MHYPGVIVDKSSRILNCKAPFKQDPSIIDYHQDSDEEWEELHGENLEDDEAVEEEM
jgi:predicted Ser/Thr protein kinase